MKQTFWFFNTKLVVETTDEETGGRYDLVDGIIPPGIFTPLHRHNNYSEDIYVLEGELTVYTPGSTLVLKPGDRYFIPAGTPHVVGNNSDSNARGLTVASPGGFAKLIIAGGTPEIDGKRTEDAPGLMERFMRASADLGDEILGPPGARP